jgi:hypothetical protein
MRGLLSGARFVSSKISNFFAIFSIFVLLRRALDFGLIAPLQLMSEYYEKIKQFLFGWAEPYLLYALHTIMQIVDLHLSLYPHWRDVYLLIVLYFSADVMQTWERNFKSAAIYDAVIGFILALVSAVACGTRYAQDPSSTLLLVMFPIAGIFFYGFLNHIWNATTTQIRERRGAVLKSWGRYFYESARYDVGKMIVFCVPIVIAMYYGRIPIFVHLPSPGLIILAFFVVLFASYHVLLGSRYRVLGMRMLQVLLGVLFLIIANAGLKYAGL